MVFTPSQDSKADSRSTPRSSEARNTPNRVSPGSCESSAGRSPGSLSVPAIMEGRLHTTAEAASAASAPQTYAFLNFIVPIPVLPVSRPVYPFAGHIIRPGPRIRAKDTHKSRFRAADAEGKSLSGRMHR
ncbi:hypothetical protein Psi01_04010 [Planobispora siamensis]|uniref:Uncharacterized protein n=1 Tax=Planobispora siamensis TaxID=936338 RepID=A0A8J3S7L7_9ACTN|nr:hypothetical protein Psi01_04010 [Planobispora siamensis]